MQVLCEKNGIIEWDSFTAQINSNINKNNKKKKKSL